jgi:hypothetical protein
MKTVEEIIGMFGGVDGLYVSITNEPCVGLLIEHVGEGPHGLPAISVTHYDALKGDLGEAQEMCLEVETTATGLMMHPYMFQTANPRVYKEVTNDRQDVVLADELRLVRCRTGSQFARARLSRSCPAAPLRRADMNQTEI